jgi:hypothetical protein
VFALNTAVGLPLPVAVVTGFFWAVLIFSLDRMLVVSMTRVSGWARNILAAVPRLLLAFVLGAVISVPLVLRIFEPEINDELQVLHAENIAASEQALDRQFADIDALQRRAGGLQDVVSGRAQPAVASDPDVAAAQGRVDDAEVAYQAAVGRVQCELDGTCGTGVPGVGDAYQLARSQADSARVELDAARAALDAAMDAAKARIGNSAPVERRAAQDELDRVEHQLASRQADRTAVQNRMAANEAENDGLLARLEALDRVSAGDSSLALTRWSLNLLFLLIEMLPVIAKLLTMTGRPTLYDRLLVEEEESLHRLASQQYRLVRQVEQHRVDEQIRASREVATLLADLQVRQYTQQYDQPSSALTRVGYRPERE